MIKPIHACLSLFASALLQSMASACPFCGSEIADKVWSGIFNNDFVYHVASLLAPFLVLVSILVLIVYGPGAAAHEEREES